MAELADIVAIVEPEAKALGFDLVRVILFGAGDERTLQIMAERPETGQLNIDDCAALSRRISEQFDILEAEGRDPIDGAYRLEVSSPGIDRPLTRMKDFAGWTGHEAKLTASEAIEGRKQFRGLLRGVDGQDILIDDTKHGPSRIPFTFVASAKLVLTDALISATVPLSTAGADEFQPEEQED